MESLYDLSEGKKPFQLIEDVSSAFLDLDPAYESSIDLSELINNTASKSLQEWSFDCIFPSLKGTDLEVSDDTPIIIVPQTSSVVTGDDQTIIQLTESDLSGNSIHMPIHLDSSTSGADDWEVCTIKTEDLADLSTGAQTAEHGTQAFVAASPAPSESASEAYSPAPTRTASTPGRKPSGNSNSRSGRKRSLPKDSNEYKEKRARNNVAVRRSRDKAKQKQQETEERVNELTNENEQLQKKVELLSKELNVLKSLFINVGAALPVKFDKILE